MTVIVIVDGASRGQGVTPGVAGEGAVGVVILKNGRPIGQYARGIGKATNNAAELEAILTGVILCWANPELADPIIYSDSQVATKMVNGEWVCRNTVLRPLLLSIQEIKEVFRFRVIQVPRAEVSEADKLAKMFLDKLETKIAEEAISHRNRRRNKSSKGE